MEKMKNHTRRKLYSWLLVIAMVFSIIQPMPGSEKEASASDPSQDPPKTITVTLGANNGKLESQEAPEGVATKTEKLHLLDKEDEEDPDEWDKLELPKPTRHGFTFDGWWTAANGGSYIGDAGEKYEIEEYPAGGTINLYAHWEGIQFDDSKLVITGSALVYDGKVKEPEVIVKDEEGNTLVKDEDYIVDYPGSPNDAGYINATDIAKVRINGIGDYAGRTPITGEFEIAKRKVTVIPTDREITRYVENVPEALPYRLDIENIDNAAIENNSNLKAVFKVDNDGDVTFNDTLNEGHGVKLKKDAGEEVGSYQYDISEFENNGDISNNFELSLEEGARYTINTLPFDDEHDIATFKVTLSDDAGEGLVNGAQTGDYYVYNGSKKSPAVTVKRIIKNDTGNAVTLEDVTDYIISADGTSGTDIGTYTITITGTGQYSGVLTKTWKIIPKTLEPAKYQVQFDGNDAVQQEGSQLENEIKGATYDGNPHKVTIETVDSEDAKGEDIKVSYRKNDTDEYTEEAPEFTEAGTYTVYYKVESGSHYNEKTEKGSVTFKIAPRPISIKVNKAQKTFGNPDPDYTYKITSGNLVGGYELRNFQEAVTRTAGENVDSDLNADGVQAYPLAINVSILNEANPNYEFTDSTDHTEGTTSKLTIKQKRITVTAKSYTKEYLEDVPQTYEYTVTDEDGAPYSGPVVSCPQGTVKELVGALECLDKSENPAPITKEIAAGTYAIKRGSLTAEDNPNYKITFVGGQYIVEPRDISTLLDDSKLTVAYVEDENDGSTDNKTGPIYKYDDAYHSPAFEINHFLKGNNAVKLEKGTDYTLQGDTKKKDMGYYDVKIVGKGNFTGEITRKWLIAVQYGEKETTYNGKEQPYESIEVASKSALKLRFPEGSKVEYNVLYTDADNTEKRKEADYVDKVEYWQSIDNLSFKYNYVVGVNDEGEEFEDYPGEVTEANPRPNFSDAGVYYVYYKVTTAEDKEPVYFSYKLTINKKPVVLVAVDNQKIYRAKDPKFAIKVIGYDNTKDENYYTSEPANHDLQAGESALCSGDKLDGYKAERVSQEGESDPIDVGTYVLKVVRDASSETEPSFDKNYEVKHMCAGTYTVNKAPFGDDEIALNEFYAPSPSPFASNDRDEKTVTSLRELMTGEKAVALGFKDVVYHTVVEGVSSPIGITYTDTDGIINQTSVSIVSEGANAGDIKLKLAANTHALKEATITIAVASKNYANVYIPVKITTKKNKAEIKKLETLPAGVAWEKSYDGGPIPIESGRNYKDYLDITGMYYDKTVNPAANVYVDPEDTPDANLDYNLQYAYAKVTDDTTEPVTTEALNVAPKDVGKYKVTISMPENDEYEAAEPLTVDYEITPYEINVNNVPSPLDREYNGTDVAAIPSFTVTGVAGESFTISGLTGTYQAVTGDSVAVAGKDVRLNENSVAIAKPVLLPSQYADGIEQAEGGYTVTGTSGAVLSNYKIKFANAFDDNKPALSGVITRKPVDATVPTPAPRDYNGSDDAIIPEFNVVTAVSDEAFTISGLVGNYQDVTDAVGTESVTVAGKDVRLNESSVAIAKPVLLPEQHAEDIAQSSDGYTVAGTNGAILTNYSINFKNAFNGNNVAEDFGGVITKRAVKVRLQQGPSPRPYDGTDIALIPSVTVQDDDSEYGTAVTGESFKVEGLKGKYQPVNNEKGKDVATVTDEQGKAVAAEKPIKVVDPYTYDTSAAGAVPALVSEYRIAIPAGSNASLTDADNEGKGTILTNYTLTFDDTELKGKITKKPVSVTLENPGDKDYDGTPIATIADVNVGDGVGGTGVSGETFKITGITGTYQKLGNDNKYVADKNVAYGNNDEVVAKKVKLNNPYTDSDVEGYKIEIPEESKAELVSGSDIELLNYNITFANEFADSNKTVPGLAGKINPKKVVYKISAEDKIYDGTDKAELKYDYEEDMAPVSGEALKIEGYAARFNADGKRAEDVKRDDNGEAVTKPVTLMLEETEPAITGEKVKDEQGKETEEITEVKNYIIKISKDNIASNNPADYVQLSAKIMPRPVMLATTIDDKVYDGTTAATVSSADVYYMKEVEGSLPEAVTGTGIIIDGKEEKINIKIVKASFDSKNVVYNEAGEVTGQAVTVICDADPYVVSGTDIENYDVIYGANETKITEGPDAGKWKFTSEAVIIPKELTVAYNTADKLYDGTDTAVVAASVDTGIAADKIKITGTKGKFVTSDAGSGIKVEITDNGTAAPDNDSTVIANYSLVYPKVDEVGADITKRKVKITAVAEPASDVKYGSEVELTTKVEYQKDAEHEDIFVVKDELPEGYAGDKITDVKAVYEKDEDKVPGTYNVKVDTIPEGTYPNYDIECVPCKVTIIKADGPDAPTADDIVIVRPENGTSTDGSVTVIEPEGKQWKTTSTAWADVPAGGIIENIGVTSFSLKIKETKTHNESAEYSCDISAKEPQAAPATLKLHKATKTGATDGSIDGVDSTMEYSVDGGAWTPVDDETTSLTGLTAGAVISVRYMKTNEKSTGAVKEITVDVKTNMPAPDVTDITVVKATSDKNDDGKMVVPETKTGLEYSVDNGTTWNTVIPTEVTGLPVGAVLVRTKTTDVEEYNPSEAVKLIVGNLEDDKNAANKAISDEADAIKAKLNATTLPHLDSETIDEYKTVIDTRVGESAKNIATCTTVNAVEDIKEAAVVLIDQALESAKDADKLAEEKMLEDAKKAAKDDVQDAKKSATDAVSKLAPIITDNEIAAYIGQIDNIEQSFIAKTDAVTEYAKADDITTYKDNAIETIEDVVTTAKAACLKKAQDDSSQIITTEKTAAKTAVEQLKLISDEDKKDYKDAIDKAAKDGIDAIEAVKDPDSIGDIADAKVEAVETIIDIVKNAAKDVINSAVEEAAGTINSLENLSDTDKESCISGIGDEDVPDSIAGKALKALEDTTDTDEIKKIGDDCAEAIAAEVDKAVKTNLDKAKEAAKASINAAVESAEVIIDNTEGLTAKDKTNYKNLISSKAEAAVKAIDKITSPDDIEDIAEEVEEVEEVIANVKTESKFEAAKNIAVKAIKAEASKGIESINDMKYLADADKKTFRDKISAIDAEEAVEDAETVAEINSSADAAKAEISKAVTDAAAANFKAAKKSASKDMLDKRNSAVGVIDAMSELTDEENQEYTDKIDSVQEDGDKAIDAITDSGKIDDVLVKRDETIAAIDKIVNDLKATLATPDIKNIKATESAGEDGVISGVDGTMEYSVDGGETWIKVEEGESSIKGLKPGTVQIRYAGTEEKPAGKVIEVTVPKKADTTATVSTATAAPVENPPATQPTPSPVVVSPLSAAQLNALDLNKGLKVSQVGKKITVQWGKVDGADGYEIFVQYCGSDFKAKADKTAKKVGKVTVTKINGKKLDLKKNYKVRVRAYKMEGSKKKILGKTIDAHIVGKKNRKFTNVKNISLTSKADVTIAVGNSSQIKAKTILVDKKKKQLSNAHATEFRYASSNPNVAKVNKSGNITAIAPGTCTVYVYARNGFAKEVNVTVQ